MKSLCTISLATAAAALFAATAFVPPAFATGGLNFTPSGIVAGHYGTISVNTTGADKTGKWGMILKTLDDTDVGADRLTVLPGGYSGWHSHPSAVFVTVLTGSVDWYDGANPACPHHVYTAGQSFIEPAGAIHDARNPSGSVTAEFVAIHINPTGTSGPSFRVDEDEPTNCAAQ